MLAMSLASHKGGGGGGNYEESKGIEEDKDILTTLRRLRQTLQECHQRVGHMDQKFTAGQPKRLPKNPTKPIENIDFSQATKDVSKQVMLTKDSQRNNSSENSQTRECEVLVEPIDSMKKDHPETETETPNGLDNKFCVPAKKNEDWSPTTPLLSYLQGFNGGYHENKNGNGHGIFDKVDLLRLAEKHANELCKMYNLNSSAKENLGCVPDRPTESLPGVVTETKQEKNVDLFDKNPVSFVNGVGDIIPELHCGNSELSENSGSKELSENKKPKYRSFVKKKAWWAEVNKINTANNDGQSSINKILRTQEENAYNGAHLMNGSVKQDDVPTIIVNPSETKGIKGILKKTSAVQAKDETTPKKIRHKLKKSKKVDFDDLPEEYLIPTSFHWEDIEITSEEHSGDISEFSSVLVGVEYNGNASTERDIEEEELSLGLPNGITKSVENFELSLTGNDITKETTPHAERHNEGKAKCLGRLKSSEIDEMDVIMENTDSIINDTLCIHESEHVEEMDVVMKDTDSIAKDTLRIHESEYNVKQSCHSDFEKSTTDFEGKANYINFDTNMLDNLGDLENQSCDLNSDERVNLTGDENMRCLYDGKSIRSRKNNRFQNEKNGTPLPHLYPTIDCSREKGRINKLQGKRKPKVFDRQTSYRGNKRFLVITQEDNSIKRNSCQGRVCLYSALTTFVIALLILMFAGYVLLTVPIVTMSVKRHGGPIPI